MRPSTAALVSMIGALGMTMPVERTTSGTYNVTLGQTDADRRAMAEAEAKRARKNARRATQRQSSGGDK